MIPNTVPDERSAIFESINAGKILDPVPVEELRKAWNVFARYQGTGHQTVGGPFTMSVTKSIGRDDLVLELFTRCTLLALMQQNGVTLTDSLLEEVASTPLGLQQMHQFAGRCQPPH